jgi:hypothetical protein
MFMTTPSKEICEAIIGPLEASPPKAVQLFLLLQLSSKSPTKRQIHPSRKRRRAEKIAPSCPL